MSERMAGGIELAHLVLRCADLEASRAFYETVGLVFAKERHGAGPEHFACAFGGFVLDGNDIALSSETPARSAEAPT